jgi:hypothetical protein
MSSTTCLISYKINFESFYIISSSFLIYFGQNIDTTTRQKSGTVRRFEACEDLAAVELEECGDCECSSSILFSMFWSCAMNSEVLPLDGTRLLSTIDNIDDDDEEVSANGTTGAALFTTIVASDTAVGSSMQDAPPFLQTLGAAMRLTYAAALIAMLMYTNTIGSSTSHPNNTRFGISST